LDGSGRCKVPSTPFSTGLCRIIHLNMKTVKHQQMCSSCGYRGTYNVTPQKRRIRSKSKRIRMTFNLHTSMTYLHCDVTDDVVITSLLLWLLTSKQIQQSLEADDNFQAKDNFQWRKQHKALSVFRTC
jgi:hypothetical protein